MKRRHYDVVIAGGGLAGLSLARQLLRETDRRLLVVDKRPRLPAPEQKVGEATVQVSGYYFSKVLDLEEYLLHDHLMKYNLRFYWKHPERDNRSFEDYSQAYIRPFSNIASYQLDRNKLEAELLRRNRRSRRFELAAPARIVDIELDGEGPHRLTVEAADGEAAAITADWVVDCTGRGRVFAHKLGLLREGAIRHGSAFMWVDGTLNIERLTGLSPRQIRLKRDRAALGHLPIWLATNHFMGEGFWFWVIPLQGKTSLGLVYDKAVVDQREVASAEALRDWVCREFPLFERDLPQRKILHFAGIPDFGYDCAQTLSADRWALSGMAGRFSDPLYSPGGDLIAIYNTLITDAIATADRDELAGKVRAYEQLMRAVYEAYVPSYAESYAALGDAEAFVLKYTWELTVYFAFYVFPFINDLFTDRRFLVAFFNRFGRLGAVNRNLHAFLSGYYRWAKESLPPVAGPVFHDFPELAPLAAAEKTFYKVGLSVDEAKPVLARQLANLEELARFALAYLSSMVLGDPAALAHREFVSGIDVRDFPFDPEAIRRRWAARRPGGEPYRWSFDAGAMEKFRHARLGAGAAAPARQEVAQ